MIAESTTTQDTTRRDLESLGCKIISALSAKNAWQLLETGSLPDLVILDYFLTGEDGPSFFRRLKLDRRFSKIPVAPIPNIIESPSTPTVLNTTPEYLLQSIAMLLEKNGVKLPILFKEKLQTLKDVV